MFGPTGLPVTPAPGKEQRPEKKDRPDRRETIHLKNVKNSEAITPRPVIHGVVAPTDHIKYNHSGLANFLKFWDAIIKYERKEGSQIAANSHIDDTVRERLIATDPARLGNGKFMNLDRDELYNLMQSEFRPKDRLDFMEQLNANVEFKISDHFRPSPEYFRPFYDALLVFMTRYVEVHEVLIIGIRDNKAILPRVDNKEFGLVRSFVAKIPFEYGTRVLNLLSDIKWDNLYDFVKDFRNIVERNKKDSESARALRRTFGGTRYEKGKLDHKLQQIQEMRAALADPDTADGELAQRLADEEDEAVHDIDAMLAAAAQHQPPRKMPFEKPAAPRGPFICLTKVLHGKCTKPNCNYEHKDSLVVPERIKMRANLDKLIGAHKVFGPQRAAAVEEAETDAPDDAEY